MLPGTIGRGATKTDGLFLYRASRWAEPRNVFGRTQAEVTSFAAWLALATIIGIAISTTKVSIRLQAQDLQLRVSASRALLLKLQIERDALNQRIAELGKSSRIEELARTKLGMIRQASGADQVLP